MSDAFTSPSWYRVAASTPRLRRDVGVTRQLFLGRPWYVLCDGTSGKAHRVTPTAYAIVGALDGRRRVADIWERVVEEAGADAPTQEEVITLLARLHAADLLAPEGRPDLHETLARSDRERRQSLKKLLLNPLSITLPLFDPQRFLDAILFAGRILPRGFFWIAAAALVAVALALLPAHLDAIASRGLEGLLDLENLVTIALAYPVVKALHELGHALTLRARGGEVHEIGVMLIAFYPIPYVEASSSIALPAKIDRIAVSGAGIAVELAVGALAFLVWIGAEPGAVRSLAYNVMLIAGFSTLVVNANPLMRFDGYFILCDLIEIPDLARRGNAWWGEVLRVHVLGTRERNRTPATGWERVWFTFYPPMAYVYRIGVALVIALFVATAYRAIGVVLAAWSLWLGVVWPALKVGRSAFTDGRIRNAGARAAVGAGVAAALVVAVLALVPAPHRTVAEAVVWLPPEAALRAEAPGVLVRFLVPSGARVEPGDVVAELADEEADAALATAEARLERALAVWARVRFANRAEGLSRYAEVEAANAALARARERSAARSVRAQAAGRLEVPRAADLVGRFLSEGDVVGHVVPDGERVLRLVVRQQDIALVRERLRDVRLRFPGAPGQEFEARIAREAPAALHALPSAVLSVDGGGRIATRPGESGAPEAVERLFQFDLALVDRLPQPPPFGMRVHVRLAFEPAPLAVQAWRAVRLTFLDAFDA